MGISKEAIVSGVRVLDYIPQRHPIVMVDVFYGIDNALSESGLTVSPDNIFVENGLLTEGGLIEHVAQSGALRIGYEHITRGEAVPLGFIGSVSDLVINRLPMVSSVLRTKLMVENDVFGITLFYAEVKEEDDLIMSCRMKVALEKKGVLHG